MAISRASLLRADRGAILVALAGFAGKPGSQWLSARHPARAGRLPLTWAATRRISNVHIIEAVAAAAPNHCLDGWSFVSRAIAAYLAGDLHATRHLSYYAQLRAALSILGHLGVGIFNGINFAIDNTGAVIRIDSPARGRASVRGLGTHTAVWDALALWVAEPAAARKFLELIRIGPTSLLSSLDAVWPGASATTVAGTLLQAWGLDLRRGKDEHLARNISSYNPQCFDSMPDVASERLEFIEGAWSLFEPTSASRFDLLDRHLLRAMLWQQHDLVSADVKANGAIARRYLELPAGIRSIASLDFLVGDVEPDLPMLLTIAKSATLPAYAADMLARALLLLRVSTAFTISNFTDAGVANGSGNFRP